MCIHLATIIPLIFNRAIATDKSLKVWQVVFWPILRYKTPPGQSGFLASLRKQSATHYPYTFTDVKVLTRFPVPVLATQPHHMTDSCSNFTLGNRYFSWNSVWGFFVLLCFVFFAMHASSCSDQITLSLSHLTIAFFCKMLLTCPDVILHTLCDSSCDKHSGKAFCASPFQWAFPAAKYAGLWNTITISGQMFL